MNTVTILAGDHEGKLNLKEFTANYLNDDLDLGQVVDFISQGISEISRVIRTASVSQVGTTNLFGDKQLAIDIISDQIMFDVLKKSGKVSLAASEEKPVEQDLGGVGFSVAFDPLDGSSIIDANFSVGTIFGIWPGRGVVGRKGQDQVGAGFAVYGPRTTLVLALDHLARPIEFTLNPEAGVWILSRRMLVIQNETKIFAPANLRATMELPGYKNLVNYYTDNRYTLRYTGGMVPDVNHILIKGNGIFSNPASKSAPAKLRLLYECAPLAKVVHHADGRATDGKGDLLERTITSADERSEICLGSSSEVGRFLRFMSESNNS